MVIKAKYEIGDRVWIVYENKGEACIYDDYIEEICVNGNGIYYILKGVCIDRKEEDIILYTETDELVEKIKKILDEIKESK